MPGSCDTANRASASSGVTGRSVTWRPRSSPGSGASTALQSTSGPSTPLTLCVQVMQLRPGQVPRQPRPRADCQRAALLLVVYVEAVVEVAHDPAAAKVLVQERLVVADHDHRRGSIRWAPE